ncbi:DUF2798 domain-containing protein [Sulfurovum mangrovi]|uniref:DUF2798 domain-containing protein n=1 Tax=Sulfurovum mangrovi TaxID=2893889 RepID=UPI001E2B2FA2|nr:DUF2798 domain-containing protein [Sulfurovum mangrovi]UFH60039.1 DUF2798 domain-containing protein [Sulfurovum mangrovi]
MIPKKYEQLLFAFLISLKMSRIMSGVITSIKPGLPDTFLGRWYNAWYQAFMVALPAILLVGPLVRKSIILQIALLKGRRFSRIGNFIL